jgi:hypothetical protein
MASGGLVDLLRKGHGIAGRAPSKMPSQHELCIAFDGDETIGIPSHRVAVRVAFFLASDESPYLITLNVSYGKVVDGSLHEALAVVANDYEQVEDGVAVDACDSFNRTHRYTFDEQAENIRDCLGR